MNEIDTKNINCRNCIYFYITWDRNFPNGCKLYGFKSKQMPNILVYQSSGSRCTSFKSKK